MRIAAASQIDEATRSLLQKQARRRSVPVRVAVRSRIVSLAADGRAAEHQPTHGGLVARAFSRAWHRRFTQGCAASRPHTFDCGNGHRRSDS